jgi:hypothetical protein
MGLFYLFLQDLEKYAGPNAVQEWKKLLVSCASFPPLNEYMFRY